MGRHLHFDLVGGIAGDMAVAALVDAGADLDTAGKLWERSGLPPAHWVYSSDVPQAGLAGSRFEVTPEDHPPTRTWPDIRGLIGAADLPPGVTELALAIFGRLATVEATVHGCDIDDVHFHEVGALDSIVDIALTAILVDALGADSFSCGPVPVSTGTVETAHGHLPLPAPATLELLKGFELHTIPGGLETVTPTGAAILATLCEPRRLRPNLRVTDIGTGFGSRQLADRPNMLRVLLGERSAEHPLRTDPPGHPGDAVVIEASIDDLDPRVYKSVSTRLLAAGALDVTLNSVQMKKSRPGTIISVVARPEDEPTLSRLILAETTTLGVRSWPVSRRELDRHIETATTPWGEVRIKVGALDGARVTATPEYDDCEIVADQAGVPVKDVIAAAAAAAGLGADVS